MSESEVKKLREHLTLLQGQYVDLISKSSAIERQYNLLQAHRGDINNDSFASRILRTIADLFDKNEYSDLTIHMRERDIKVHKFVLTTRSNKWSDDLSSASELDWTGLINHEIGELVLRWAYTDELDFKGLKDKEHSILEIIKLAQRFDLAPLVKKGEESLIPSVTVHNCVQIYQSAVGIKANRLKNHCSEMMSTYWNDLLPQDFVSIEAGTLLDIFKEKTKHPLHSAIRNQREDVVLLCLFDWRSSGSIKARIDEPDESGNTPLALAMEINDDQFSIAKMLLDNNANVDARDGTFKTPLHRAIERKNELAIRFLLKHGASVDISTPKDELTPLHLLCSQRWVSKELVLEFIQKGANPDLQDGDGNTCLHIAIKSFNVEVFSTLILSKPKSLDTMNKDGFFPLSLGLSQLSTNRVFAEELIKAGASVDSFNPSTRNFLLHSAILDHNEEAGLFLLENGAKVNSTNRRGETPLHLAAASGLERIVQRLIENGAYLSVKTTSSISSLDPYSPRGDDEIYNRTPLHLAIINQHENIIRIILEGSKKAGKSISNNNNSSPSSSPSSPNSNASSLSTAETASLHSINSPSRLNLDIKDSNDETPLSIALRLKLLDIAQLLIDEGADPNVQDSNGYTLLHKAIMSGDSRGALFLLNHGADISLSTPKSETPLQLAVNHELESVLIDLCSKGADVNTLDVNGNSPLWNALERENEDIASILVQYDCDTNCWGEGPDKCWQNMLHRALDENNEFIAIFLIRSNCDHNSPRRKSPSGGGEQEASDGQTPLHMACAWGLEQVVQHLLEFGANVNAQDAEGKTPLHEAIYYQHGTITSTLLRHPSINLNLRDKNGNTPFATAMNIKNNKAAQEILNRDPNSAENYDSKGYNFLHTAIKKVDIESVLFLLSIHVNVHSRVQDTLQMTPLHLAVEIGSELIIRNLLLAGANINDVTSQKQTSLHLAAEHDHSSICSVLLDQGIDFDAKDANSNNALHIACQKGHLTTCKVLLSESNIQADACNLRGQTPLHLVAQVAKESAATIFELFISTEPNFPINKQDNDGNTPLLLAYINGNVNLCRALVRSKACLGISNKNGVNLFNCHVASKNLLYKLLDYIVEEPVWTEGDACSECNNRFTLALRKHHCRHCGRLLCSRCSAKMTTIPKFNLNRSVRVCEICYDVLEKGFST
ncbi:rabankyrin-5 [Brevipalpus obovatus]|uniref:rabankyrin-5 n=1 Tax=Brevipalpus obovatus TaxID=246614 RepID=UPI003D9F66C4